LKIAIAIAVQLGYAGEETGIGLATVEQRHLMAAFLRRTYKMAPDEACSAEYQAASLIVPPLCSLAYCQRCSIACLWYSC
jgi:hypothetical protein